MIFYFTGTGNSLYLAKKLAELTEDKICSIAEIMAGKAMPDEKDSIGLVFPTYAWAPPQIILDFTAKYLAKSSYSYFYAIASCAGSCGNLMHHVEKAAKRPLDAAFSVAMPNNDILTGDVESEEKIKEKLITATNKIEEIAKVIMERKTDVYEVTTGACPAFKSDFIAPIFHKYASSTKPFYAEDTCIACGKCARVCPVQNIKVDKKPVWGNNCTMCSACLHICPTRSVQRGKGTKNKGRYRNPKVQVKYNF